MAWRGGGQEKSVRGADTGIEYVRSGIGELHGGSIFSFLRALHTVLCSNWTN